jgi:hypothetical protein
MCDVLLPPGINPTAVKYIYHIIHAFQFSTLQISVIRLYTRDAKLATACSVYYIFVRRSQWQSSLKAWVSGSSLAGIVVSNTAGCMDVCDLLVSCVFRSASGRSLVQKSPTKCGVSECDREASIMRRSWPNGECCAVGKKKNFRPVLCDIIGPKTPT